MGMPSRASGNVADDERLMYVLMTHSRFELMRICGDMTECGT